MPRTTGKLPHSHTHPAAQYQFIAPNLQSPLCDSIINKALTLAGFLHICLVRRCLRVRVQPRSQGVGAVCSNRTSATSSTSL